MKLEDDSRTFEERGQILDLRGNIIHIKGMKEALKILEKHASSDC